MKISASILSSNDRIQCVRQLNYTDVSYIHIDVMDGKFVSDIQFESMEEVRDIYSVSQKKLDVHLMVNDPIQYIDNMSDMNIEFISFHVEIEKDIKTIIDRIHAIGAKASIAIKPNTDLGFLLPYLDDIDMILIMSVEPGKGGQTFIPKTEDRIKQVIELIGNRNILIEVDGGINDKTIDLVSDVDIAVVGSYIIKSDDYHERVGKLLGINKDISTNL